MEHAVVHRIVEQHAATAGDRTAIVDGRAVLTYRDLNHQANAVARCLMNQGFRRGSHLAVSMSPGTDLAVVLLAALKAGGAYTWDVPAAGPVSPAVAFASRIGENTRRYRSVALDDVLRQPIKPGPNLPILCRPTDVACVLGGSGAGEPVLVPHATIAALRHQAGRTQRWHDGPTAFDLWAGLMTGATLSVGTSALRAAA